MKKKLKNIPSPSAQELKRHLKKWNTLRNGEYKEQEEALEKLFKAFPTNSSLSDVLAKVAVLNTFYSTGILAVSRVAQHIVSQKIDEHLKDGDPTLVRKLAKVKMNGGKERNFYSFATKYCSFHNPEAYPIFDKHVKNVLSHWRGTHIKNFKVKDLRDFPKFVKIIRELQTKLSKGESREFALKEMDRYLWQLGGEGSL